MAEYTALEKHACAACGAQAEWNPERQALVCSYCATVVPATLDLDTGAIAEIDLAQALRDLPDEARGWQAERRSVRCRSCQAVSVFDPARVGQRCEFCGSSELVDYDEIKAPIRPRSLLPFKIDRAKAQEILRRWWSGRWLAPGRLRRTASLEGIHGVYVPYWTFDARVHTTWTAESGTYYTTTESYRDSQGNVRTRAVRHVRWSPAAGELDHVFDDQLVPGTRGVDLDLLHGVEPFPTGELVPYSTTYLAGFVVEHYQIVLFEAARSARTRMEEDLRQLCGSRVPGDTYRNLQIFPAWSGETFKHVLVPIWLLGYRFAGKPFQVVVNGSSGSIAGRYPKSVAKVVALVAAAVIATAVGFYLSR